MRRVRPAHGRIEVVLVLVDPMYRRPRLAPMPDRTSSRRAALAILSLVIPLAACTSGTDPEAATDPDQSPVDGDAGPGGDPDAALGFGDPGDVEGFEPVTDIEVEPVDGDDLDPPELSAPDTVVPAIVDQMAAAGDGDGLLDTVDAVDTVGEVATQRDGRSRNEAGEPATLDEAANLACAQIELAIDQIDSGLPSVASERIIRGAEQAELSELADVRAWAEPLADVVVGGSDAELAPLVGFLTVCTEGGYEL